MSSRRYLLVALALVSQAGLADQVYRWRDADGSVYYSDKAPPPQARDPERKRLGDRASEAALPYPVQQARRQFPVTLFVAEGCGSPCSQASAYLAGRGVPYTERNAADEEGRNELMGLSGGKGEVPLLVVGKTVLRGFHEAAWANALDAASYPKTSQLPPGVNARQPGKAPKETTKAAVVEQTAPPTAPSQGN